MADHPIMEHFFASLMILIFETLGTGMLAMLFTADHGGAGFFIGFFILLIFSARISGSHYNPVVTLAYMLRKDSGSFNKWLGILYMIAQTLGAIGGVFAAEYFFGLSTAVGSYDVLTLDENLSGNYPFIQAMISETLGGFILVLAYLTQTEENYKLSSDAAITLLIISAAYLVALALSHPVTPGHNWSQSPLNPAIALAMMTFALFSEGFTSMHFAWIFLVFSWFGSILAVLCFELVFKKAQDTVEKDDEIMEEHEAQEEIAEIAQPLTEN